MKNERRRRAKVRLPKMKYSDGYTRSNQVQFGAYNHTKAARDGDLYDMKNLTSDEAPLIASRRPRSYVRTLTTPGAIGGHDKLFWVDGKTFYYDGAVKGEVAEGSKQFVGMGARIIIWPDKKVYHTELDTFESLEATMSGTGVQFTNGTLYDEEAECNTVICTTVDFSAYFSVGDAVEISGCTKHTENNKTPVIREISEDGLLTYTCTVPANTTATLRLPAPASGDVREGDGLAKNAYGVTYVGIEGESVVYELESGSYSFTLQIK